MSSTKIPDDLNHRGYKPQPSKPSQSNNDTGGGTAGYTPPPNVDNITKPPKKISINFIIVYNYIVNTQTQA